MNITNSSYFSFSGCPYGFVESVDDNSIKIFGDCSLACVSPYWTQSEWSSFDAQILVSSWLSVILTLLLIISYAFEKDRRKQYLIISMGIITGFEALIDLISMSYPPVKRFCKNESQMITSKDGLHICNIQCFTNQYCLLACALCWMLQVIIHQ